MRSHGPSCKRWRCSMQLLFHFPCWTWSITLNGNLAQSSLTSWSPPSIPRCPIAASSSRIFLSISRTEPVLKHYSIAKCINFPFQRVLIRPKLIRTRELCPFHPSAAICPDEFQNAQRPMFLPYLLVRVFKFIDLECVGMRIWWSFWISTFFLLVQLWTCAKFDENSGSCSRTLEMLTNLIFSLIMNSWERFVMPAKQFKCTIYPQGDGRE